MSLRVEWAEVGGIKRRVVVPPYVRADGTRVGGYAYDREGGAMSPDRAEELYQGDYASVVNASLRGIPRDLTPEQRATADDVIAGMDAAIAGADPLGAMSLYRGVNLNDAPGLKAKLVKGGAFRDGGFLSVTHNEVIADNFAAGGKGDDPIVFNLTVPPGTRGLPIHGYQAEDEYVLPRGGRFTVTSDPYVVKFFGVRIDQIDVAWEPG